MRKTGLAFAVVALLSVWSAAASASVLYDSGTPDLQLGYFSDTMNSDWLAYDDFTLASDATITDMHWWGFYYTQNTPTVADSFLYSIRTSPGSGGQPGAEIASGSLTDLVRTDTGTVDQSLWEVYKYDAVTAGIPLAAGEYYLSIYDTAVNPVGDLFAWCESASGLLADDAEWSQNGGTTWFQNTPDELAFNLTDDAQVAPVPEPATMTLLGLGLAGLVGRSIRKRAGK